jgi:hypothetical protein
MLRGMKRPTDLHVTASRREPGTPGADFLIGAGARRAVLAVAAAHALRLRAGHAEESRRTPARR